MKTKTLLALVAVLEFTTGIGLLLAPDLVAGQLLGGPLGAGVPLVVARVAGLALISIGLVCWLERTSSRGGSPTALLVGLLAYNAAVPVLLVYVRLADGIGGIGAWPAVVAHVVIAIWIAAVLRRP